MSSMKDVAKLAGVSVSTVSHVLNKTRKVNPGTQGKVLQAVKELKYNINPVARNLRKGHSKLIGIVVSNLANSFFMDIALSIEKILKTEGYHLIFINSNEDKDIERENIENLVMQNVDGLIIAPVDQDCSYMESIMGTGCYCVFFDRLPNGYKRDCIMSTNYEGAFKATEALISNGHKRIGFIGSHFDGTMKERIEGFKGALKKHKIPIDTDLLTTGNGGSQHLNDLKNGDGNRLARYLVEEKKVTAILCGNELAAVGAVSFLQDNNYSLPDDVAIITFDNAFWLSMTNPAITAVNQDREAIGKTAAKVLLDRINGVETPFNEYRIPTNLIIRSSSKQSNLHIQEAKTHSTERLLKKIH